MKLKRPKEVFDKRETITTNYGYALWEKCISIFSYNYNFR